MQDPQPPLSANIAQLCRTHLFTALNDLIVSFPQSTFMSSLLSSVEQSTQSAAYTPVDAVGSGSAELKAARNKLLSKLKDLQAEVCRLVQVGSFILQSILRTHLNTSMPSPI